MHVRTRLALFRVVDVLLNCAMKDGLNLLPFEYVLTKSVQETSGVIVLSEFVGCSHVLNGGMRVNPFNLEHVVEQVRSNLIIVQDYWMVTMGFHRSSTRRWRCPRPSAPRGWRRTTSSSVTTPLPRGYVSPCRYD